MKCLTKKAGFFIKLNCKERSGKKARLKQRLLVMGKNWRRGDKDDGIRTENNVFKIGEML